MEQQRPGADCAADLCLLSGGSAGLQVCRLLEPFIHRVIEKTRDVKLPEIMNNQFCGMKEKIVSQTCFTRVENQWIQPRLTDTQQLIKLLSDSVHECCRAAAS